MRLARWKTARQLVQAEDVTALDKPHPVICVAVIAVADTDLRRAQSLASKIAACFSPVRCRAGERMVTGTPVTLLARAAALRSFSPNPSIAAPPFATLITPALMSVP